MSSEKCYYCEKIHNWNQVYVEQKSKLIKVDKLYMCWRSEKNNYLLKTNEDKKYCELNKINKKT